MNLLSIALLFVPLLYHLWNDRNGDAPEDKTIDILIVAIIACAAALLGYKMVGKPIIDGLLLAGAIHFMVFDYAINYILSRRRVIEKKIDCFSYLGKSFTDDILRQWTPMTRFWIKAGILVGATLIYFI